MRLNEYTVEVGYENGIFIDSFHITSNDNNSSHDVVQAMIMAKYRLPKHLLKKVTSTTINKDKNFIKILIKG